jgi:hypothetical protein
MMTEMSGADGSQTNIARIEIIFPED